MSDSKIPRLRIVSDGTAMGTEFFNAETGEKLVLPGVTGLRIEVDADRRSSGYALVQAHLSFDFVELDMRTLVTSASTKPASARPIAEAQAAAKTDVPPVRQEHAAQDAGAQPASTEAPR